MNFWISGSNLGLYELLHYRVSMRGNKNCSFRLSSFGQCRFELEVRIEWNYELDRRKIGLENVVVLKREID